MGITKVGSRVYWRTPQIDGLHDFNIRIRLQSKLKIRFGIKDEYLIIKRYGCIGSDDVDHYGRIIETVMFNLKSGQIDVEKSKEMGKRAQKSSYKVKGKNYGAKLNEFLQGLKQIVSYSYMGGVSKKDKDLKIIKAIISDIERGDPVFVPGIDSDLFGD